MRPIDAEVVKEFLKRAIFGADAKIDRWIDSVPTLYAEPALPCKIGDTVFAIREFKGVAHVQETKVSEMYFTSDMRLQIVCKYVCRGEWEKRVFRTREEAEAALKERDGNA